MMKERIWQALVKAQETRFFVKDAEMFSYTPEMPRFCILSQTNYVALRKELDHREHTGSVFGLMIVVPTGNITRNDDIVEVR
jgi:hypothetical protein